MGNPNEPAQNANNVFNDSSYGINVFQGQQTKVDDIELQNRGDIHSEVNQVDYIFTNTNAPDSSEEIIIGKLIQLDLCYISNVSSEPIFR